jgi:hypothetical protein
MTPEHFDAFELNAIALEIDLLYSLLFTNSHFSFLILVESMTS